jgi:cyclic pyranopterin phosphate synthase
MDHNGNALMVDISAKTPSFRTAVAEGIIGLSAETMRMVREGGNAKGDVLSVAQLAGIMAAKRTAGLIPLCHPLPLTGCRVLLEPLENCIRAVCEVKTTHVTGVEMEALTGVSVALLTVYDMCKAVDKSMEISGIRLLKKTGGKSGDFSRS